MVRFQPYDKLFIYTIHGPIGSAAGFFGDSLLSEWEDSGTTLLFFESPMEGQVRNFLDAHPGASFLSETIIDHKDWEAGRPVAAHRTGRFLVCPTWDMVPPAPGEIRIVLDPGVAFGSGFHPTTRTSLIALERIFEIDAPKRVLDLGCGTGILSIAALMLGAEHVTSVDYASMAHETAHRCFELNGIHSGFTIIRGDVLDTPLHGVDLIISNIYIQVIEKLFRRPEYAAAKWLLISGIHGEDQHLATKNLIENSSRRILWFGKEENWYTYITALYT